MKLEPREPDSTLSRRSLLRRAAVLGIATGISAPSLSVHAAPTSSSSDPFSTPPLPPSDLLRQDPERFWARVRSDQFQLAENRAFLNPGSLGAIPKPVLKQLMVAHTRQAEWPTDEAPRWGYEVLEDERAEMGAFLGCKKEELAFTHNCTEGMSIIAGGLDLKAGDEVIMTNQEHPGGYSGWRMRAARTGIVVREVEIPVTPKDPGELADRLLSAIGPKTRVMMFSGITSPTGLVMPVKELCRAVRERGVISVVDGAHMDGQVHVNLTELGCDYFTGSPHKWMFAPAGCGLLFGRESNLDRLWPAVCNSGWDNASGLHAARFMMMGTNNKAIIEGMMAGLRFLKAIGPEAVYARQHHLIRYAIQKVRERPYVELVTPDDDRMFNAMLSIRFKESELTKMFATMKEANIYVIGGQRSRLSANIYARPSDIDAFFAVSDRFLKGG